MKKSQGESDFMKKYVWSETMRNKSLKANGGYFLKPFFLRTPWFHSNKLWFLLIAISMFIVGLQTTVRAQATQSTTLYATIHGEVRKSTAETPSFGIGWNGMVNYAGFSAGYEDALGLDNWMYRYFAFFDIPEGIRNSRIDEVQFIYDINWINDSHKNKIQFLDFFEIERGYNFNAFEDLAPARRWSTTSWNWLDDVTPNDSLRWAGNTSTFEDNTSALYNRLRKQTVPAQIGYAILITPEVVSGSWGDQSNYAHIFIPRLWIQYTKTGTLRVDFTGGGGEGRWRRTGTSDWLKSGDEEELPIGNYTIEYKSVAGWNKPANNLVSISWNNLTQFSYPLPAYTIPPPSSPTGVSASDGTYTDKIRITWNSASGATSYEVWRNTSNNSGASSRIGPTSNTEFNDTTAIAGTTYYYWIKSVGAGGTSSFSSSDSGYRRLLPPQAPTGVSATDGAHTDKVRISWNASSGATLYEVWRNTDSDLGPANRVGTPDDVSNTYYDDVTAVPGITYYYWVRAKNSGGTSGYSSSDSGYRKIGLPPAPNGVSAGFGAYDKIRITWNNVIEATSYEVWRATSDSSSNAAKVGNSNSASFDDTSAVAGTIYYYWVKSKNSAGTSGFSSPSARGYRSVEPKPSTPHGVTATYGTYSDKIVISWTGVGDASSYEIWRNTSNDSGSSSRVGTSSGTTYSDTSASAGTIYYYWIKAVNSGGSGDFSSPAATGYRQASSPEIPTPPTGVSASDGTYSDKVRVVWNSISSATSYEVWRSANNNSGTATKIGSSTASPFDDTTAVAGITYYYWVKAKNTGGTSGFSSSNSGYRSIAITLADAVDAPLLTWTTGGNANWFGQTTTTHDGVDAAQSGAITHNQESWMQTTVSGPGTVTFWWKVSSENTYDFLRFYIGSAQQQAISGNSAWQQRSFAVPAGNQTLRWAYTKDYSVDSGSDCAWVDQVVWTPGNQSAAAPIYRFYSPVFKGHFFTASEGEKNRIITTLAHDWRYEGVAYYAMLGQTTGTAPLYRFWSDRYKGHFFTVSAGERDRIINTLSHDWRYEGIAYHVYPAATAGTLPVHRFWSPRYKHHFYTISTGEKDRIIATLSHDWRYEGVAFHALPSQYVASRGSEAVQSSFSTSYAVSSTSPNVYSIMDIDEWSAKAITEPLTRDLGTGLNSECDEGLHVALGITVAEKDTSLSFTLNNLLDDSLEWQDCSESTWHGVYWDSQSQLDVLELQTDIPYWLEVWDGDTVILDGVLGNFSEQPLDISEVDFYNELADAFITPVIKVTVPQESPVLTVELYSPLGELIETDFISEDRIGTLNLPVQSGWYYLVGIDDSGNITEIRFLQFSLR